MSKNSKLKVKSSIFKNITSSSYKVANFKCLAYTFPDDAYKILQHIRTEKKIGPSIKIIPMSLKITITLESEGEKRHFHSYRLLLLLLK